MPNFYAADPVTVSWVRGNSGPPRHINVGDALSPYLVAMVSGRPVKHAPFQSSVRRVGAIGTVGQSFSGGEIDIWGTGCSPWLNPLDPATRSPYKIPAKTKLNIHATRGPMSSRLLSDGRAGAHPFGDPAVLLPRFYDPTPEKKWDLGMVLHLSELENRLYEAEPRAVLKRYAIPDEFSDTVRLITMVAEDSVEGVKGKLDELLSCKRIVSTSLHGIAIAIAYGIPCLYLGGDAGRNGIVRLPLDGSEDDRVNARFIDLYGGYGQTSMVYWRQRRRTATNLPALMRAVDKYGVPLSLDCDALIEACPAGANPLTAPADGTIWDHPLIRDVPVEVAGKPAILSDGNTAAPKAGRRLFGLLKSRP